MVLNNIANMMNRLVVPQQVNTLQKVNTVPGQNPFANPFVNSYESKQASYAKNQPVFGGYFAGYYNGKPNVVGRKLFIEA